MNPLTSNGDPLFFLGAIRHKLLPLARACLKVGHSVSIAVPDHLEPLIEATDVPLIAIDTRALSQAIGLWGELDYHIYQSGPDTELVANAARFYREAVPSEPDLVVLWENTSFHLAKAFPEAILLHLMPGFLGRLPYPELVYFDTLGLFKQSRIYQESQAVFEHDEDARSVALVAEMRDLCAPFFQSMDRIAGEVDSLVSGRSFSSVSLLPMQYSKHFNFRVDTPYQSQSEYLLDVLAKQSSDTGILVTQYVSGSISDAFLSADFLKSLERRHQNVLYDPKFDRLDNISQFLLPFADSVITCSSSLGLQGVMYGKSVDVVQDTFLSRLIQGAQQNQEKRIKALTHLLGRSSIHWKRLLEPDFLSSFLEVIVAKGDQKPGFDLHSLDADYGRKVIADLRFSRTVQKSGSVLRSEGRGPDYISPSVIAALNGAQLVSFDIFDTLIERPLAQPADLFLALERRWKTSNPDRYLELSRARVEAEAIAKAALPNGIEEVSFDQIYESLALLLDLSSSEIEQLKALELELESQLLTFRPIGKKLYDLAKAMGKRVVYASDMYLPGDFIRSALEKNGFDPRDNLYLSCELGLKKKSGTMFAHLLEAEAVGAEDVVHFGDNPIGDDAVPKAAGIRAYRLPRAIDRMRAHQKYKSRFKMGGRGNRSMHESGLAYLIARRLFDNPFSPPDPDSYFGGSATELGYCGFGPCVADFALWLGQRVLENENDGIYFVARDGRIVMEAFNSLFPDLANRSAYIFGSRRLLRTSFVPTLADLYATLGDLKGHRPSDLLWQWYGWEAEDPVLGKEVIDESDLMAARAALKTELVSLSESNDANSWLLRQHAEKVGLTKTIKPALVEFGYAGTIQDGFSKALGTSTRGYYFTLFDTANARISEKLPMEGYVSHLTDRSYSWHGISQNGFLYETLFCSDESTILGLREVGGKVEAVREASDYDAARRAMIRKVHRGAKMYASDFSRLLGPVRDLLTPEPALGSRVLDDFVSSPTPKDASILEGVIFSNNFKEGTFRYVVPPKGLAKGFRDGSVKVVWPRGSQAFLGGATKTPSTALKNEKTKTANTAPAGPALGAAVQPASVNNLQAALNLEQQFRRGGKPNLLRESAEHYVAAGDTRRALELLQEAAKIMPRNTKLRKRMLVLRFPLLGRLLGSNEFALQNRGMSNQETATGGLSLTPK